MRDIVNRIDEILPFLAAAVAASKAKPKKSGSVSDEEFSRLVRLVVYHPTETNWKTAAELVIKQQKVSKVYAKKLRQFFKKRG